MTTPIPPMPTLRQDRHGDYSWSSILELQSYAKQGWSEVRELRAKLEAAEQKAKMWRTADATGQDRLAEARATAAKLSEALKMWKSFPHSHLQSCDACYKHHQAAVEASEKALAAYREGQ